MKKVIITAAIGEARWMEWGVSRLRAYAHRVGAEFIVISQTDRSNPQHVFFDALEIAKSRAKEKARFLWMDADILPTENALDLFLYCDPRSLWGSQPIGNSLRKYYLPWVKTRFPHLRDHLPYLNTGLVMFDSLHAVELLKHDEDWEPVGDQEPFNVMWRKAGLAVRMVPHSIHNNWSFALLDFKQKQPRDFYHCGGRNKLRKMKQVLKFVKIIPPASL